MSRTGFHGVRSDFELNMYHRDSAINCSAALHCMRCLGYGVFNMCSLLAMTTIYRLRGCSRARRSTPETPPASRVHSMGVTEVARAFPKGGLVYLDIIARETPECHRDK